MSHYQKLEKYFLSKKIYIYPVNFLKKLAAISFLLLLLFNLFGYRILFYYAQQQSDRQLVASLDKEVYNEEDLITIKIPLSLPYITDTKDFERVNGEINLDGKIYKYVKRKVSEGRLVLLCLPDQNKMRLETAKGDFFKNTSDIASNTGSKKPEKSKTVTFNNAGSEYEQLHGEYAIVIYQLKSSYTVFNHLPNIASSLHNSPEQPPEIA